MSGEQAVAVGVRVFGIWLLFKSMEIAVGVIFFLTQPAGQSTSMVYVIPALVYLVLGGYLAWAPRSIARFLLPNSSTPGRKISWSRDDFQSMLFSVLGAYFLITEITDLNVWISMWFCFFDPDDFGRYYSLPVLANTGSSILKMVAGICLILGTQGIRNIIHKLRNLGTGQ